MPENEETPAEPVVEEPQEPAAAPEAEGAEGDLDLERAKEKIRKANSEAKNLRKRLDELEPLARRAKELEDAQKSEQERLSEQLSAAEQRIQTFRQRAVRSEVRALAADRFADPDDAHAFLDLDAFVDEDGEISADAIRNELADLLKRKPHLARPADNSPRRPAPDRTQGSSGNGNRTPSDPGSIFAGIMDQALKGR